MMMSKCTKRHRISIDFSPCKSPSEYYICLFSLNNLNEPVFTGNPLMLVSLFFQPHALGTHKHPACPEVSDECVLAVLFGAGGVGKGQNSQASGVPGCFTSCCPVPNIIVVDAVEASPDPFTCLEFSCLRICS